LSILLSEKNKIIIQGITGKIGTRLAREMAQYGSQVVGGVSPGHKGEQVEGVPVFDFVKDAVLETNADSSLIMVPGAFALDAIIEAAEAGIKFAVYPGEGMPIHDILKVRQVLESKDMTLLGGNTPGIISPGKAKMGFMPDFCYKRGPVGVISKSGSLSYEVSNLLSQAGLGQSTVVGIGGDAIKGLTYDRVIEEFGKDKETKCIVMLGEIGGTDEIKVAKYITSNNFKKPIVSFIVGRSAPKGEKMGHAGAIVSSESETYSAKVKILEEVGVKVAGDPYEVIELVKKVL